MSNNKPVSDNGEQKPSLLWKIIKQTVLFLLPGIKLLRINSQLKKVQKFYKHAWFNKQRARNLIVSIVVSLPFLLSISLSTVVLYKDADLARHLGQAKNQAFKLSLGEASSSLTNAFTNYKTKQRLSVVGEAVLLGTVVSFILGTAVIFTHPLIRDSKKLTDMLKRNGVIEKDDKNRMVLATPLGFLIDVTGNTAKEIKDNERIWMALNIRVTDWAEDPEQRAIVFFKKAYSLRPRYDYKI